MNLQYYTAHCAWCGLHLQPSEAQLYVSEETGDEILLCTRCLFKVGHVAS